MLLVLLAWLEQFSRGWQTASGERMVGWNIEISQLLLLLLLPPPPLILLMLGPF